MPGLGGTDGNFSRFKITNFAHEHDVRIMPQNRTQSGGEGQADLIAHLDLHGPFELVFDRILEGDDFAAFIVGLGQRSVKGRGLSAAGRAGEQHQPLG